MKPKLEFKKLADDLHPDAHCEAYSIMVRLHNQGGLKSYNPAGIADCHVVAIGILDDLDDAGFDLNGWEFVRGICVIQGLHSWLEYENWVVDFSSGLQHFVAI